MCVMITFVRINSEGVVKPMIRMRRVIINSLTYLRCVQYKKE